MKPPKQKYRPGVGVILLNDDSDVFVGQRADRSTEAWQMPQGGIDRGEDPEAAMWREMKEEIGTDRADIIAVTRDWVRYELPDELQGKLWGGKYIGQEQLWYCLRFTGSDSDINLEAHQPAEFITWKWEEPQNLADLIVPFKRELYRQVLVEFADYLK